MRGVAAFVAGLTMASAAQAQGAPERMFQTASKPGAACAAPLGETGKPVTFPKSLNDAQRGAVFSAIFLTLHDPAGVDTWPEKELEGAAPCALARFTAGDVLWTVSGGQAPAPLRWLRAGGREDFLFLVKGPSMADAEAWDRGGRRGLPSAGGQPTYLLVNRMHGLNFLLRIYDGPPSDKRLADDVADFMEDKGDIGAIAVHDPAGDAISLFLETDSGAQAEIFRPQDLKDGAVAVLYVPDGNLFGYRDGAFVMRGSGFACAETYGAFERDMVGVLNPFEPGLDLACYLKNDTGFTTVFVTHAPDATGDKARWTATFREKEQETGVSMKLSNPPQGSKSMIQAGRNWVDSKGLVQTILFLRRGEYLYEVRQTHTQESVEPAGKALMALLEQIDLPDAKSADGWRARR